MDNSNNTSYATRSDGSPVWAHPDIRSSLSKLNLEINRANSIWAIDLNGDIVTLQRGSEFVFSLSLNGTNLRFVENYILKRYKTPTIPRMINEEDLLYFFEATFKELGLSDSVGFKPLWLSLLKSFSLQATLESYLNIEKLQGFTNGLILIHPKGETNAWQLSFFSKTAAIKPLSIQNFNSLFQSLKKTKSKNFSSSDSKWSWLPLNGVFVADIFSYKKFNVIWINSREEFLSLNDDDFRRFKLFSKIIYVWLERLIDLEFSDIKSSDVMWLIENLPFDLVIKDRDNNIVFSNTHFSSENIENMNWLQLPRGYLVGYFTGSDVDDFEIDVFQKQKILLLGDLFNTLRHELSNPLFGLRLSSELIKASVTDSEFTSIFSHVMNNIQRSQDIIHNLSKLYSGDQIDADFELVPLIKESITLAKSELKGIKIDISNIQNISGIKVEAKSVVVLQIIFNLIINAAQALKNFSSKPQITIDMIPQQDKVIIKIIDNGPGLPQTIRDNLFKPFHTTKNHGHGLGLALSKDLATKIDGDLLYIPREEGTEFNLLLKRVL